jgi:thiaminase/transcriptional activator TenA
VGFSEELRNEAAPIWRRIFDHPFLKEAGKVALPLEKFRYFLIQDHLYLEGFGRAVALALTKAPSELLEGLSKRVSTPMERPLHRKLMPLAGVSLEEAEGAKASPTCLAYVNHLLRLAAEGSLGVAASALLPCPWTYHLLGEHVGRVEHPVYGPWSEIYAGGFLEEGVKAWRGFVDGAAEEASEAEREAMRRAFMLSSRYEFMFWDMAYRMEEWAF